MRYLSFSSYSPVPLTAPQTRELTIFFLPLTDNFINTFFITQIK